MRESALDDSQHTDGMVWNLGSEGSKSHLKLEQPELYFVVPVAYDLCPTSQTAHVLMQHTWRETTALKASRSWSEGGCICPGRQAPSTSDQADELGGMLQPLVKAYKGHLPLAPLCHLPIIPET